MNSRPEMDFSNFGGRLTSWGLWRASCFPFRGITTPSALAVPALFSAKTPSMPGTASRIFLEAEPLTEPDPPRAFHKPVRLVGFEDSRAFLMDSALISMVLDMTTSLMVGGGTITIHRFRELPICVNSSHFSVE